jgi:pyridine nucleotide-disulfide oxidoreductase family protein
MHVCSSCGARRRISVCAVKRLLLIGGGHAHIEVLRQFGLRRDAAVDITLVSPEPYAAYSGMLPGLIAGHYQFHECHIDLGRVARFARARFLNTSVRAVESRRREVRLADGTVLGYDIVSINVGAIPAPVPAFDVTDGVVAVKPVAPLLRAWEALIERVKARRVAKILMVGGGVAGVELLLAMHYRLQGLPSADTIKFALVTDADRLLPAHNVRAAAMLRNLLAARDVELLFGSPIRHIEPGAAVTESGVRIAADTVVWATGGTAMPPLQLTGIPLDRGGFVIINPHLHAPMHDEVFAAGDCASMLGYSYPKSGVYAVHQGRHLAGNLRRALAGERLVPYYPQPRALALIGCGGAHAVAVYGPCSVSGAWVWRWKQRIDRKFVAKYNNLAAAPAT